LPPLNGITTAPLLQDDGAIISVEGYRSGTGMWCERVPDLDHLVPFDPTIEDAASAFRLIRDTFRAFCFADSPTIYADGVSIVDTYKSPGKDESAFLIGRLTAVCRPSQTFAPGLVIRAASVSGAGTGKGLLARCISTIAFGRAPHAVTAGSNMEELEKRIVAELIEASPTLFLDNLNNSAFKSDLLASAITESPARVRVLGKSEMRKLNAAAFVVLTGNGLTITEDLARRFVVVNLDAGMEDPESRPFERDILKEIANRRSELLAALLTIWRWGRKTSGLARGLPFGSFESWTISVRDPMLALGCQDPVERVRETKQQDSQRQQIADIFSTWWDRHQGTPVRVNDLDEAVRNTLDPQCRGRQYLVARVRSLVDTRAAGFKLTPQLPPGKWGVTTYALESTAPAGDHRDHREHRFSADIDASYAPDADVRPNCDGRATNGSGNRTPAAASVAVNVATDRRRIRTVEI
jgi:hypothetical protein